ncbi:MAG: FAD-dependent oxidoreductase [Acidobacteriota bacterium]
MGAGIQGCSIEMELASTGCEVDLFDQASEPMQKASRWNEGKLHLGYVYGRDPSLLTARKMIEGSLDFHDFFARHFESTDPLSTPSKPFYYAVPKESVLSAAELERYFRQVDELLREALGEGRNYVGRRDLQRTARTDLSQHYEASRFQAAIETPEVSVDTHALAARITDFVDRHDHITFHPGVRVTRGERARRFRFEGAGGQWFGPYDRLVNATWESRLTLDATLGIEPPRRWLHRFKMALHLTGANTTRVPSTTMVLGAFGDLVNFGNGDYYLSWYRDGKLGESRRAQPPRWEEELTPALRQKMVSRIRRALVARVPGMREIDFSQGEILLRGGYIFAWGDADIDQWNSQLHQRFDVGVSAWNGYYSVDTGKYCLATLHARECARLVRAGA